MENKLTIKQAPKLTGYSEPHLRRLARSVRALTALDASWSFSPNGDERWLKYRRARRSTGLARSAAAIWSSARIGKRNSTFWDASDTHNANTPSPCRRISK